MCLHRSAAGMRGPAPNSVGRLGKRTISGWKRVKRRKHMRHGNFLSTAALILPMFFSLVIGCDGGRVAVGTSPHYEQPGPGKASRGGPPPWAPAHGHRAKYRYLYYPSPQVYLDTGRNLYFYYRGGQWEVSAQLPAAIRVQPGDNVTLEMNTDRPYRYHSDVVKRYPPGRSDAKRKDKSKK
jgi:hypothetical protein